MSDVLAQPSVESAPTDLSAVAEEINSTLPENPEVDLDEAEAEEFSEETSPEQAIEAAAKAGDITKKQAQEMKKKLKIKVDGEESEIDLDWNDEEALKREIQKARAFDKRAKEHATYKSQVDQLLNLLQTDPEALLEKMGLNVDEFAEKRLMKKVEELKKSPEQIEKEKMAEELERFRKEAKEAKEKQEKAELEKARNEQAAAIQSEIVEALEDAKSFIPKDEPEVYAMIAQYMLLGIQKGYHNITPKDVIPLVEKRYKESIAKLLRSAPDEVLESLVTKDRLDGYRKNKVQARKATVAAQKPKIQDTGTRKPKVEKESEQYYAKDFFTLNPRKK